MATASFRIRVDPQSEHEVNRALLALLRSARNLHGCVRGHVERDVECPGGLRFHCAWKDEECLLTFLMSGIVTELLQILELSLETPETLICWEPDGAGFRHLNTVRAGA